MNGRPLDVSAVMNESVYGAVAHRIARTCLHASLSRTPSSSMIARRVSEVKSRAVGMTPTYLGSPGAAKVCVRSSPDCGDSAQLIALRGSGANVTHASAIDDNVAVLAEFIYAVWYEAKRHGDARIAHTRTQPFPGGTSPPPFHEVAAFLREERSSYPSERKASLRAEDASANAASS